MLSSLSPCPFRRLSGVGLCGSCTPACGPGVGLSCPVTFDGSPEKRNRALVGRSDTGRTQPPLTDVSAGEGSRRTSGRTRLVPLETKTVTGSPCCRRERLRSPSRVPSRRLLR